MATMPAPKIPPVALLLMGGALWLMVRRKAVAATSTVIPVRAAGVSASNPPALASALAEVALGLSKGLTFKSDAKTEALRQATAEDARAAVRAGDSYYGEGAWAWFAGNSEAARAAVREGDAYYTSSWSAPAATAVTVTAPQGPVDSTISAPVYDPAVDADRWAGIGWDQP